MSDSGRVSPEAFLKVVPPLFEAANQSKQSIHLSIKRLVERNLIEGNDEFNASELPLSDVSMKSQFTEVPQGARNKQYDVLVRIKKGHGDSVSKHSTVVKADQLDKFWKDYSSAIKGGMIGLVKKKRTRTRRSGSLRGNERIECSRKWQSARKFLH
ncbi:LADA_0C02652g1_1 [Lachancea dasiensis]|uniref:LADA_0C02652g1_1 n=1 Tax=Lachancea dasiensis TaxID=1072105 RepID=A0A1G4IY95_9SACH|nr:LADA_0C02652g1_1 [Lachancea dasiensis]